MSWVPLVNGRPKPYRLKDFLARERYREDYRLVAEHLLERLDFESVMDVGCGNGFLLQPLAAAGKRVAGVDHSAEVVQVLPPDLLAAVQVGDFAQANSHWDLVCCIEVAEHVPPERSEDLVAALVRMARRWIYFSAAPPGQAGRGHINCRPVEDWLGWFAARGWHADGAATESLRRALARLSDAWWLRDNGIVLRPD